MPGSEAGLALGGREPELGSQCRLGGYRAVRVGEAQVPGPQTVRLLSLNTGGAPGVWRLCNSRFLEADVLCLQEVAMSPSEWQGFARVARGLGYYAYYAPGTPVAVRGRPSRFHAGRRSFIALFATGLRGRLCILTLKFWEFGCSSFVLLMLTRPRGRRV